MKKSTNQFFHLEGCTDAERNTNLVKRALARNEEQLAAQKLVVASAKSDWELLLARIKLSQLETDGKILRGEKPGDNQFLISGERARRMTIRWDFNALMKTKLK